MSCCKPWFRWRNLVLLIASIPVSLAGSVVLYFILIRDPCRFHPPTCPNDAELPMWIRLFFTPEGPTRHPEPNALYFSLCVLAGFLLTTCLILLRRKRFPEQAED